jgi:hypothetical protein
MTPWIPNPYLGTENGYRRSDQFLIHVVDYGTRKGKRVPDSFAVTQPTLIILGVFSRHPDKGTRAYVVRSTRLRTGLAEEGVQPPKFRAITFSQRYR